jgi:hypothetical protein
MISCGNMGFLDGYTIFLGGNMASSVVKLVSSGDIWVSLGVILVSSEAV